MLESYVHVSCEALFLASFTLDANIQLKYVLLEAPAISKEGLRCLLAGPGVPSVMITGTTSMLLSYADNWDFLMVS